MLAAAQRSANPCTMQAAHQEESFPTRSLLAMGVDKEGQCAPQVLSEGDRICAALGNLVVLVSALAEADVDEEACAREVETDLRGQSSLSETILEERRAGP